jgi:hypothetical protein
MADLMANYTTGQPTQHQIDLSAQAAAQQMEKAGGTPAQVAEAATIARNDMLANPAPNGGFLGLSMEAWIALAAVAGVGLVWLKK